MLRGGPSTDDLFDALEDIFDFERRASEDRAWVDMKEEDFLDEWEEFQEDYI